MPVFCYVYSSFLMYKMWISYIIFRWLMLRGLNEIIHTMCQTLCLPHSKYSVIIAGCCWYSRRVTDPWPMDAYVEPLHTLQIVSVVTVTSVPSIRIITLVPFSSTVYRNWVRDWVLTISLHIPLGHFIINKILG
jgi:hypothetical protein